MTDNETPVEPPAKKSNAGCIWASVIFGALWFGGCVALIEMGESSDGPDDLRHGAFDVCTGFVEDALRAPASASFPNYFEDDGEVTVSNPGEAYIVDSHVDSENGFGAMIRTDFTCTVRHTGDGNYRLINLDI